MSKKQKRWRISDIMDAIVREHEARGVDVSEHDYGNMKPCPRCAAAEWGTSTKVADALVTTARRLNVPMNG